VSRARVVSKFSVLLGVLTLFGCSVVGTSQQLGSAGKDAAFPSGTTDFSTAGGAGTQPPRPLVQPVRPFEEVRGLWVVRSTMTSAFEVREMVERASAAGFNTILVQIRGRADAFYNSRLEPRAETVTDGMDFDPLAYSIEQAHARGIAVHAWVNTHLVWGAGALPRSPRHLVNAHPEWLAVPKVLGRDLYAADPSEAGYEERLVGHARDNAHRVEGLFTSPSHPEVKDHVYSVWMDLTDRYDLDGIHFDYVRFPSGDFDYSSGALERFQGWASERIPAAGRRTLEAAARDDPYAFVDALPNHWDEFRRMHITDLVRRIYQGVKLRRPRMVVSAAVFANQDDAYRNRYQDWPLWLEEGILDVAVPMAYTVDNDRFRTFISAGRTAAGPSARLWAGIGAYLDTETGTLQKIDLARSEGVGGVVLFSYDWAVGDGSPGGGVSLLERIGRARFGVKTPS
jgi:uncharacterized lipoprotein YddW (UPF0748 family)